MNLLRWTANFQPRVNDLHQPESIFNWIEIKFIGYWLQLDNKSNKQTENLQKKKQGQEQ